MKRPYKRKLTLWFTGDTTPMRPGVYQVSANQAYHRRGSPILYAYWNGARWSSSARTAELACADIAKAFGNRWQNLAWRGRTEP
jgi:hypothetical protein